MKRKIIKCHKCGFKFKREEYKSHKKRCKGKITKKSMPGTPQITADYVGQNILIDFYYNINKAELLCEKYPEEAIIRVISAFEIYFKRYFEIHPKYIPKKYEKYPFQDIENLKTIFKEIENYDINRIDDNLWKDIIGKWLYFRHLTVHNASKDENHIVKYVTSKDAIKALSDVKIFIYKCRKFLKENDENFNENAPASITMPARLKGLKEEKWIAETKSISYDVLIHTKIKEQVVEQMKYCGIKKEFESLADLFIEILIHPGSSEIIKKIHEEELIFRKMIKWESKCPIGTKIRVALSYETNGEKFITKYYENNDFSIIQEDVSESFKVNINMGTSVKDTPLLYVDSVYLGWCLVDKRFNNFDDLHRLASINSPVANNGVGDLVIVTDNGRKALALPMR